MPRVSSQVLGPPQTPQWRRNQTPYTMKEQVQSSCGRQNRHCTKLMLTNKGRTAWKSSVACQLSAGTSYWPGVYGQLSGIKTGVIHVALFFTLCKFCCVSWFIRYNPLCSSPSITQSQRGNHFLLKLLWPQVSCGMFVLCLLLIRRTDFYACVLLAAIAFCLG